MGLRENSSTSGTGDHWPRPFQKYVNMNDRPLFANLLAPPTVGGFGTSAASPGRLFASLTPNSRFLSNSGSQFFAHATGSTS